jgi:NOL1/NOP2/fmu family ribosome biogenesis protein
MPAAPEFLSRQGKKSLRIEAIESKTRSAILGLLEQRFGIDRSSFLKMRLLLRNDRDVHVVAADHHPPPRLEACPGIPLVHLAMRYPKLTTAGATAFGRKATRNLVETDAEQIRAYLKRAPFRITAAQSRSLSGNGYVIVRHQQAPLGLGFYRSDSETVASRFPKSLSPTAS